MKNIDFFISEGELERRKGNLKEEMEGRNIDLTCFFQPSQIIYLTGIYLIPTERPIALLFDKEEYSLFLPLLEGEHAEKRGNVRNVITYDEYPGKKHPMRILGEEIEKYNAGKLGADSDGYGSSYGYRGPSLSDVVEADVTLIPEVVEELKEIKSQEEIDLLKKSAEWANYAHRLLQEYTEPGKVENEIAANASLDATMAMNKALGGDFFPLRGDTFPASAVYYGQIGRKSALPHSLTTNETIEEGDVLTSGAGSDSSRAPGA